MGLFDLFRKPKNAAETSVPQTAAERWLVAACAIWSDYCGGSWNYIGGFEKTASNAAMLKDILSSDWLVTNHDSGIEMVNYLLLHAGEKENKYAFNYACAINICGRMYLSDFMTREEYVQYSAQAGQKLQQKYHSWDEFCHSYIEGTKLESGVANNTQCFIESYSKLVSLPNGPYEIDWNLTLPTA